MSRTTFASAEANIVVSSDGFFDVYPPVARSNGDKPAYRGTINELGGGLRGANERLAIRPTSAVLSDAVGAWSRAHGAAAVRGEMGLGRNGVVAVTAKPGPAASKPTPAEAKPAATETAKSKKKG